MEIKKLLVGACCDNMIVNLKQLVTCEPKLQELKVDPQIIQLKKIAQCLNAHFDCLKLDAYPTMNTHCKAINLSAYPMMDTNCDALNLSAHQN